MATETEKHRQRKLRISTGESRYGEVKVGNTTWSKLVTKLTTFVRTDELFEDYQRAGNEKLAIKDVGWIVGGPFEPAVRRKANLQFRSIMAVDLDHLDPWDIDTILETYEDWEFVLHSSHSHSDTAPRLRLVMPFTRDVTVEEYEPIARRLASWFGMDPFDDTGFQVSRVMFWPSAASDGDVFTHHNEGEWMDPDVILGAYKDWRDWGEWPTSSREQIDRDPEKKAEDPYSKPGAIGAFNRAYEIPHAIVEFDLPYTPSGMGDDRYSYTGGSSVDGAIYYADDGHLYSWHESDPARGNHNAWDLVRLHKFGGLDEDKDIPIGKRESQKQMSALAMQDPVVAKDLASADGFEDLGPVESADGQPSPVKSRLTYDSIRGAIDGRASPIDDDNRRTLIIKIAAAKLEPSEVSILASMIKSAHIDPAPTKQAILDEIKLTGKKLTAQVATDGEISDIEEDLVGAALDDHWASGEHIRRFGRQYWVFDRGVWIQQDDEIVEGQVAETFMRLRKERPEDVQELVAAVGESQTTALVARLAKLMARILAARYRDPDPLGLMKPRDAIVNCLNGELHFMRDGKAEFTDHHPELFLTSQVPVNFDKHAEAPEWDRFCGLIFRESFEPDEMQRHLEELGGYLIQYTRWLKTWVLFHGPTNAGKTTIGKVFENLLGRASANRSMAAYEGGNSHAEAGLVGKLMLLDEDFAKGGLLPDGFIKKVSEAKTITANPKNKDEFDFICRSLPIVVANHWPPTRDVSDAFRERALVFDFPVGIPAEERDDERADRMMTGELPGILNRFVRGFARLRKRGSWSVPDECMDARIAWEKRADSVHMWADEMIYRQRDGKREFLYRSGLHGAYVHWHRDSNPGGRPVGKHEFHERARALWGSETALKGKRGWRGLVMRGDGEDDF